MQFQDILIFLRPYFEFLWTCGVSALVSEVRKNSSYYLFQKELINQSADRNKKNLIKCLLVRIKRGYNQTIL